MEATDRELLDRHRPYLLWDSQDAQRSLAVESAVRLPGTVLLRGDHVLAAVDEGDRRLNLDLLADPTLLEPTRSDRLKHPPLQAAAMLRMQRDARFRGRIYGRCVRANGIVWLQYWSWLSHGPTTFLEAFKCEGDWKLIQIRLDSISVQPVALTISQRHRGEYRETEASDAIEWETCAGECAPGCRHPRIYVAPFSRSLHFRAGVHLRVPRVDTPNGAVFDGLPTVEPVASWANWPGRWGCTTGPGTKSPPGPALHQYEWDPPRFERKARRSQPRSQRLLSRLLSRFVPPAPSFDAAILVRDTVILHWRIEPQDGKGSARWILITTHAQGEPARMLGRRVVRCKAQSGETRIPLGEWPLPELEVRASCFGRFRVRGETSDAQSVTSPPETDFQGPWVRDTWTPRVWKWFCQLLLKELTSTGAATVNELQERQFGVLDLPLDRAELVAVTEHARRTGLVEPLGHTKRADLSTPEEVEWTPSESGRLRLRGVMRWALSGFGAIPSVLLIAVASLLPTGSLKEIGDLNRVALVIFGLALLEILVVGIFLAHRYAGGASSRSIATQWSRHAVEVPGLNRWHRSRLNFFLLVALAVSSLLLVGALTADLPVLVVTAAYVLLFLGQGALVAWNVLRLNLSAEAREAASRSGRGRAR